MPFVILHTKRKASPLLRRTLSFPFVVGCQRCSTLLFRLERRCPFGIGASDRDVRSDDAVGEGSRPVRCVRHVVGLAVVGGTFLPWRVRVALGEP